jgi:hypothetical protein
MTTPWISSMRPTLRFPLSAEVGSVAVLAMSVFLLFL